MVSISLSSNYNFDCIEYIDCVYCIPPLNILIQSVSSVYVFARNSSLMTLPHYFDVHLHVYLLNMFRALSPVPQPGGRVCISIESIDLLRWCDDAHSN